MFYFNCIMHPCIISFKFVLKYFILLDATVTGIVFLTSFLDCHSCIEIQLMSAY